MKQSKLLKRVYQASLSHDEKKLKELRMIELRKILDRKVKGKSFNAKWTLVNF